MHSRRAALGTLVGGAAAGVLPVGCGPRAGGAVLQVANASGAINLTIAELIRRQGFLDRVGCKADIRDMGDGSKILAGIVGGSLDCAAMAGMGQVFPAVSRGGDLRIIGGGMLLPALAMFTAKAEVRSLKDLEGRVVGTGPLGALVHQLTVTLLEQSGVDISRIRFATVGSSPDVFRAVQAGTVDGGVGPIGFAADPAAQGVRTIPGGNMAERLKDFTYQGAWTSSQAIRTRRGDLVKLLAAHALAYRFVQSPKSRDAFVAARARVFSRASEAEHLAEWNFIQTAQPFDSGLTLSPERLSYLQRTNRKFGIQREELPFAAVADMSLADEAVALADRLGG